MVEKGEEKSSVQVHYYTDHMANERTFLAWIRTSIGVMAFGFVIEKFALFMNHIAMLFNKLSTPANVHISTVNQQYSSIFGIFLVAVGALIGLFSFIKYRNVEKQIEKNLYQSSLTLAILLTILVVVIAIFLIFYLLTTSSVTIT